ncbi:hypothetical protein [Actinomadura bangladeshensis]|uniref:Uncharacterized protein n=1 Tax=Actinomadura bangladeshensis TaxID=453573 RepID=A0A6L9QAW0_9ACTN|nr:hypothetical protein [Actinomadura bangladeshensis]NEA22629.1 hypothetical protein [Actinomadura bangladeshensis]
MSCNQSNCPIRGKGPGWICSCEPPGKEDEAVREITEEVAEELHRRQGK